MLFLVGITACNDGDDDKKKPALTVKVDNLSMVENIKNPNGNDFFPNGTLDKLQVRVRLFAYDETENLCFEETSIVEDFSAVPIFTPKMAAGSYTLVVVSDIVDIKEEEVDFECWEIRNKELLSKLEIVDLGYVGYHYKMLGVYKGQIEIDGSDMITIEPKAVGALITTHFTNVPTSKVAYVFFYADKANDYYQVDRGRSVLSNKEIEGLMETESGYSGYYDTRYFLPGNNISITWGAFSSNQDVLAAGKQTINVNPGAHRTITFNVSVSTLSAPAEETVPDAQTIQQVLKVKTLQNTPETTAFKQKLN